MKHKMNNAIAIDEFDELPGSLSNLNFDNDSTTPHLNGFKEHVSNELTCF